MGTPTNTNFARRYARSFDVVNPQAFVSPFFFMAASTTGVAGQVVKYGSTEDTVTQATLGDTRFQIAGFLMQDVKDLDAGPVKGYRNLQNTVANLGDPVGVLQGSAIAFTKAYNGTPAAKDVLVADTNGYLAVGSGSGVNILAIVEAIASSTTPSNEPSQTPLLRTLSVSALSK
jgi:hypothetical protein